jgi:tripartite-type tricarboxylate transporter receptor subunit TctC
MLVAAAGTPDNIVATLHREVGVIMAGPETRQELLRLGILPVSSAPPDELKRFVAAEIARVGDVVRAAGLAGTQ